MKNLIFLLCAATALTSLSHAHDTTDYNQAECMDVLDIKTYRGAFTARLCDGVPNTIALQKVTSSSSGRQTTDYGNATYMKLKYSGKETVTPCFFMNIDLDAKNAQELEDWKKLAQTIIVDNTYDCPAGFDPEYPHKYARIAQSIIAKKQ